jgi:integral membrane protein (TIGR01906 family)
MKKLFGISGAVCAAALLGVILISGIFLPSFGMWFYYRQFEANNTYNVVRMEPEDLHAVTHHMIGYLRGLEDNLQIETVVNGQTRPFFSDIEIRHMVDVKDLAAYAGIARIIFAVLIVACLIPFVIFRKRLQNTWIYFFKSWQYVSSGIFALASVLIIIISINWDRAWWVFHEIFFNNDYWILNPNVDLLINIVPYSFFFAMSVFIGVFFVGGLILVFLSSSLILKKFGPVNRPVRRTGK